MTREAVAIVTPSLNQAPFIAETLASVLDQEGVAVDYLVVDAGSSDGTLDLLRGSKARWIVDPSLNQSAAIRKGWRETRGEIVAWINSDDAYLPGALGEATDYLAAHPEVDAVYGECDLVDSQGRRLGTYETRDFDPVDLFQGAQNFIPQPAMFIRRSALESVAGLDELLQHVMDFDLWLRLAALGRSIHHVPRRWARLRLHSAAKSVRTPSAFGPELVGVYQRLCARSDLPPPFRRVARRALSNAYYRASHAFFWDRRFPEARGAAFHALRHDPSNLRPQFVAAVLGRLARRLLDRRHGNPATRGQQVRTVALLYGHRLAVGGVETQMLSVLARRDPTRYRFVIVADARDPFAAAATALGAQIVPWAPRHAADPTSALRLRRLLARHGVDVVHTHDPRSLPAASLVSASLGIPCVATVHMPSWIRGDGGTTAWRHHANAFVENRLYRWLCDAVLYVSALALEDARARGLAGSNARLVENAVALQAMPPHTRSRTRQELGVSPDTVALLTVARLDPQKDLDTLLSALARLRGGGLSFHAFIAGDGPLRSALEGRVRKEGLDGQVSFLGFRGDVPQLLAAADLFVLPSRAEGMSMALLEAAAVGVPCIATDVGESRQVPTVVALVPPGDPEALATALARFLREPPRRASPSEEDGGLAATSRMVDAIQATYGAVLDRRPVTR